MRVAGIMSGTSLDGVDVAIVDISGIGKLKTVATHHADYPQDVRQALLSVSNAEAHTANISRLNFLLGELYAKHFLSCCQRAKIASDTVQLIGCHGQTIYHEGQAEAFLGRRIPNTFQIGEAAVIAERTGIDVVSNFRERDMAAGGKGAPLVPLFDFLVFRHAKLGRIALNLGGIGNITAIPAGADIDDVVAFDTGPANMIIDQLVAIHSGGKMRFDRDGQIARLGTVDSGLLRELLADQYFRKKHPKTAGREQYGSGFVDRLVATGKALPNLIATATMFTAQSVALAIRQTKGSYLDLIVGGGGAQNGFLMELLASSTGLRTQSTAAFGINSDFKEAIAFALLAWQTHRKQPGNVRSATGARRSVILGKLTRA
jgi:anhydro-N-acetylmuramic acid kinase